MTSNGLQTGDFSSTTKQLSNILSEAPQQIYDTEVSKQTDNQRIIEEKDVKELKHPPEIINTISSNNLLDANKFVEYQRIIDENTHLKKRIESQEQIEKEYNQQNQILQLRIKELEDWNGDYQGLLFHYSHKSIEFLFFLENQSAKVIFSHFS